ncbi:hypothetical protein Tco_0328729 [Tanacetum coccineum]
MEIPGIMINDAIKKSTGYKYYKQKRNESAKGKAAEEPKEQHVSLVKSKRGKGYMRSGDQEANFPSAFKKKCVPRKTISLTIDDNLVEKPVTVELEKSINIEEQQKQPVGEEGSSAAHNKYYEFENTLETNSDATRDSLRSNTDEERDDETDDSDMDLSNNEPKADDVVSLLNETPVYELTDIMSHPVYTDAHTTLVVHNPEGNPEIISYKSSASEVPCGTHVDVQATNLVLQDITSGGLQFLGGKLVSWSSKKQDCTAMSTAKAEYVPCLHAMNKLFGCVHNCLTMDTVFINGTLQYAAIVHNAGRELIAASSSVPWIYMAQFWHTLKEDGRHKDTVWLCKIQIGYHRRDESTRTLQDDAEVLWLDVPLTQSQPTEKSTRLTPPAPVPTVDKADEMILQDTLQVSLAEHKSREEQEARENVELVNKHLASEEIEKMVEGSENVIDDSLPPRNDEPQIPGTRLEPRSDKESPEIKAKEKRKIVEESRSTPFPTPIRSPRTHTNLVSSDTEKLQELTVTDTQTTSSSRSPNTKLSKTNRLLSLFKAKPARFKRYKNFFQELQGRYTYLFGHLKERFLSRKSFDTLADHLQEVMVESLPTMVDTHIKEQVKKQVPEQVRDQVPVYVAEGLIMERQKTKEEMERMIAKAILQERGNIQAEISSQIQKAIDHHIPSQVDASVRSYMSGHILHVHPAQSRNTRQYQKNKSICIFHEKRSSIAATRFSNMDCTSDEV